MIELEYAELHGPIFLKGTNLPPKLIVGEGPGKRRDIKLFYDRDHRELIVHFKDMKSIVPRENVANMVEKSGSTGTKTAPEPSTQHEPMPKTSAQVDSPVAHVFHGAGHGKTGRDK